MSWPKDMLLSGNSCSNYFSGIYFRRSDAQSLRGQWFMGRARAKTENLCYSVVVITWDFESHDRGSNPCSTSSIFRDPSLLLTHRSRQSMTATLCARRTF